MNTVRKIKLTILGDIETRNKQYKWIRDEQYKQYRALNLCMTYMVTNLMLRNSESGLENRKEKEILKIQNKIKKDEEKLEKELKKEKSKEEKIQDIKFNIEELKLQKEKLENELRNIKEYRSNIDEEFKKMYVDDLYNVLNKVPFQHEDMKSLVTQRIKKDFNNDVKEIMRGDRSVRNYKRNFPILTRGRDLKFQYIEKSEDIEIRWIEGIKFKCILGKTSKSLELKHTLHKVINKEYKVCDSSLQFDKNNNLILNLTLDIPQDNKYEKITNRVVGVDLGLKIPAYVALNDTKYIRKAIGSIDDFLKVRTQMQSRVRKLQKSLQTARGGKGRNKKMKALDRFREKERNFARNYNHFLSYNIVKFALDNKAEQINLELLEMKETQNKSILRNWSYYQLQSFIKYKAERIGIKVEYIDPYHTSQICSECGNYEEGQRVEQATFVCKRCGHKINADYNAARNIAMSKEYISKKEESKYYKNNKNMV
ncbi:IS200/IS605 family element transposase accessory protein TnpB [Clostridium sporogenes]|uniref:RNA-guided endonuclease InsQ/TnpB family protein n=1 Tax=Clostridium sporogenes TaxID=1509 RepID=UPI0013D71A59|nr:RNA-guided endonuclease TnpB family protein [Clostridium sporogenes]NFE80035.1 IS200/IS605 family element transposase accessory protein TnpB [Clostridium sporogenes]NFG68107.1 IS200/IS605 family element transposase accessory protein TnpB [Clostridium sporogenes]